MKRKIRNGKATLSFPRSNFRENVVRLCIADEASGEEFINVEMSYNSFATLLSGMAMQPVTFELMTKNVGKQREIKHELIPIDDEEGLAAFEALEVDGWLGSRDELRNPHNRVRDKPGLRRVTFVRFVESPDAA